MATKYVYFFGNGDADGDESMRAELGGKGANLAQMAKKPLSLPVPPGFTITTDVCQEFYKLGRKYPAGLAKEVDVYLAKLEAAMGKKLGDEKDPLLVSVRSGAAISMPGMMDTILNLGLNDKSVIGLANKTGNERFAWDAYRRFIQMYGDVAMGVDHDKFEAIIDKVKAIRGIKDSLYLVDDCFKLVVVNTHCYITVHLNKAAVSIPCETLVTSLCSKTNYRLVVKTKVEDCIHHTRHRDCST